MYTHTGYKSCINYMHRSSRLYGHTIPKFGKTHALNAEYRPHVGTVYVALCGKVVHSAEGMDDYGNIVNRNVRPAAEGMPVQCKRCKQLIVREEK